MEKSTIQVSDETKTLLNKLKGLFMAKKGEQTTINQVIYSLAKEKIEAMEKEKK